MELQQLYFQTQNKHKFRKNTRQFFRHRYLHGRLQILQRLGIDPLSFSSLNPILEYQCAKPHFFQRTKRNETLSQDFVICDKIRIRRLYFNGNFSTFC